VIGPALDWCRLPRLGSSAGALIAAQSYGESGPDQLRLSAKPWINRPDPICLPTSIPPHLDIATCDTMPRKGFEIDNARREGDDRR
jgi:hypothetical protein